MSGLRTSRTRLAGAAATVALAALALTACDDGTGVESEGTARPTGPTATAPASPVSPTSGAPAPGSSGPKTPGAPSAPSAPSATGGTAPRGPAPSGAPVTCEGSTTNTAAAPLSRPLDHLLLTVTNTGSRTCHLYGYPALRFGGAQAVPPAVEDSRPQAVVTLRPGESGYASAHLSAADGSGADDGRTENSLTVYFHGRSGDESVGTGAHPRLPAKGVHVDGSIEVTYWQRSMDDAVRW
ncbi:DUF4232 domain-containing protein [Streptomyces collinus]|uniref:DUF4232 domain-containing protein n=1 Tax=Streptomyces collinus TaxID=42684 RepID=UPI0036E18D8B